jgi:phage FluMu protein gp41
MFETISVEELVPGDVLFTGARVREVEPANNGPMVAFSTVEFGRQLWTKGTPVAIEKRK